VTTNARTVTVPATTLPIRRTLGGGDDHGGGNTNVGGSVTGSGQFWWEHELDHRAPSNGWRLSAGVMQHEFEPQHL